MAWKCIAWMVPSNSNSGRLRFKVANEAGVFWLSMFMRRVGCLLSQQPCSTMHPSRLLRAWLNLFASSHVALNLSSSHHLFFSRKVNNVFPWALRGHGSTLSILWNHRGTKCAKFTLEGT